MNMYLSLWLQGPKVGLHATPYLRLQEEYFPFFLLIRNQPFIEMDERIYRRNTKKTKKQEKKGKSPKQNNPHSQL